MRGVYRAMYLEGYPHYVPREATLLYMYLQGGYPAVYVPLWVCTPVLYTTLGMYSLCYTPPGYMRGLYTTRVYAGCEPPVHAGCEPPVHAGCAPPGIPQGVLLPVYHRVYSSRYTPSFRVHLACSTLPVLSVLPLLADGRCMRRVPGLRTEETHG